MSSLADKLTRAREVVAKATPGPLMVDVEDEWNVLTDTGLLIAVHEIYHDAPVHVLAVNALPALLDVAEALLALRGEYVGVEDMLPFETTVHVQAIDAALARLSEVLP